jgi:hypothetical protein
MAMAPAGLAMLLKSMGVDFDEIQKTAVGFSAGLVEFNRKIDLILARQEQMQQMLNVLLREASGASASYEPKQLEIVPELFLKDVANGRG